LGSISIGRLLVEYKDGSNDKRMGPLGSGRNKQSSP
jgi:hypothetical protein